MTGLEPLLYLAVFGAAGLGARPAARWLAREARWWVDERRTAQAWQQASQAAYAAELEAARAELSARGQARAAVSVERLPDARALRPTGIPLDILNGRTR